MTQKFDFLVKICDYRGKMITSCFGASLLPQDEMFSLTEGAVNSSFYQEIHLQILTQFELVLKVLNLACLYTQSQCRNIKLGCKNVSIHFFYIYISCDRQKKASYSISVRILSHQSRIECTIRQKSKGFKRHSPRSKSSAQTLHSTLILNRLYPIHLICFKRTCESLLPLGFFF